MGTTATVKFKYKECYPILVNVLHHYDVIYNDYKNEIYIKVTHYDKVLFKGSPKELLEYEE